MTTPERQSFLRSIPQVSAILTHPRINGLIREYSHPVVAEAAAHITQAIRETLLSCPLESLGSLPTDLDYVVKKVEERVLFETRPHLKPVVNATGVVLHTNLGRSPLAFEALEAINRVAVGYSNLEMDLATGKRGSRYAHVEELLCRLSGAEAAMAVNNNAAAVFLVLNTLAQGREVIVSRGQLVEIGGSFRVPEVMAQSGARLVEVGTTNKTHLADYRKAITSETGLLLKVHTSNYRIIGFTSTVELADLVSLGQENNLPVMEDVGSGVFVDLSPWGLSSEPTVQSQVAAGADIVTFSGDKLLGGPQAGIIVGRKDLLDKIKKNQLTRALRIDKLTLAALEATLRLYLDPTQAIMKIPTLRLLTLRPEEVKPRAEALARSVQSQKDSLWAVEVISGFSQVGGGSLPGEEIPTWLVAVTSSSFTPDELEELLRQREPSVMTRIQKDRLLLDLRTVLPGEEEIILNAFQNLRKTGENEE